MNLSDKNGSLDDLDVLLDGIPRAEADRLREVWDLASSPTPDSIAEEKTADEAWSNLERAIGARDVDRTASKSGTAPDPSALGHRIGLLRALRRRSSRQLWAGQAAVVLLLLLGAAVLIWLQRPVERIAPLGERLTVVLPDDSIIELNSGSSVGYDRRFAGERTVHLQGEAYFDVAHESRPFVVETFNARIEVLGTRFAARAWPEGIETVTTVTLEIGSIALAPGNASGKSVILKPGETGSVSASQAVPLITRSDTAVEDAFAWRRGDLIYKDRMLGAILADIERRYSVEIQTVPTSLLERRLNLALRDPADAQSVIQDVAVALDLQYSRTSNGYLLGVRSR